MPLWWSSNKLLYHLVAQGVEPIRHQRHDTTRPKLIMGDDDAGGIYLGGCSDDEESLEFPVAPFDHPAVEQNQPQQFTAEAGASSPPPSQHQQQLQDSNSSGLNNSNMSILHSTIEEDKEYVSDLDHQQQQQESPTAEKSAAAAPPLSPKGLWRSGSPFITVPPFSPTKNSSPRKPPPLPPE